MERGLIMLRQSSRETAGTRSRLKLRLRKNKHNQGLTFLDKLIPTIPSHLISSHKLIQWCFFYTDQKYQIGLQKLQNRFLH